MLSTCLKWAGATVVFVVFLPSAMPQELTIAAAADLRPALDEICVAFQKTSGLKLKVIYGASGNLYQQIQNGAPFDFFLSANVEYPQKLDSVGLATVGSYYEYAQGKLALLVRANSKLDLQKGPQVMAIEAQGREGAADAFLHRQAHIAQPLGHDGPGLPQRVQRVGHARLDEGPTIRQRAVEIPDDEFHDSSDSLMPDGSLGSSAVRIERVVAAPHPTARSSPQTDP